MALRHLPLALALTACTAPMPEAPHPSVTRLHRPGTWGEDGSEPGYCTAVQTSRGLVTADHCGDVDTVDGVHVVRPACETRSAVAALVGATLVGGVTVIGD